MPRRSRQKNRSRGTKGVNRRSQPNLSSASTYRSSFKGGFQDRARVTLSYYEEVSVVCTTGAQNGYVFRGNSVFDPNFTGTGSQPVNYDDWALQYANYRVHGSTCRVKPVNVTSTASNIIASFVLTPTKVTTLLDLDDAVCQPYAQMHSSPVFNSPNYDTWVTGSISTKSVMGMSQAEYVGTDTLQALTTANPSLQWYWQLLSRPVDQATTSTYFYRVLIEYDVEFFNRYDQPLDLRLQALSDTKKAFHDRKQRAKEQGGKVAESKDGILAEGKDEFFSGAVTGHMQYGSVSSDEIKELAALGFEVIYDLEGLKDGQPPRTVLRRSH